jgi:beta-N-acetylhexosaminidase
MIRIPPPGPARRRLATLSAMALVALLLGAVVGAGDENSERPGQARRTAPPKQAVKRAKALPVRGQIGQLLMIAFKGPGVPSYVKDALRMGRAGGVILFRGNAKTPAEMRAVTRTLQRAGRGRVLIAVDQEGGPIRILPWAFPKPAQSAQPTAAEARGQARAAARDLRHAGINVNLAPVADVGATGSVMQGRAFPGGSEQVALLVSAAVSGYRGTRVAATLKHFPGLGSAGRNTDDEPVTISSPKAGIESRDLPPFVAGVRAGAPLVMASHALYTAYDPRNIASQSHAVLTTLLRGKLGFDGVVITDSMEAGAVVERSTLETAALRSLSAGADILLLTGAGSFPRVRRTLIVAAKRSARFRARIRAAAARVIALKAELGLRPPPR